MADGQGRALGSGSIPGIPLSFFFLLFEAPVERQVFFFYKKQPDRKVR